MAPAGNGSGLCAFRSRPDRSRRIEPWRERNKFSDLVGAPERAAFPKGWPVNEFISSGTLSVPLWTPVALAKVRLSRFEAPRFARKTQEEQDSGQKVVLNPRAGTTSGVCSNCFEFLRNECRIVHSNPFFYNLRSSWPGLIRDRASSSRQGKNAAWSRGARDLHVDPRGIC